MSLAKELIKAIEDLTDEISYIGMLFSEKPIKESKQNDKLFHKIGGIAMSTRCEIGVMNKDGSITAQYCHHDGYPQGVGRVLLDCYSRESIEKVIHRGQLDALEESGPVYYDEDNDDDLSSTYKDLDEFLEEGADHDFHYYLDLNDRWHVIDMHWNDETHHMSGKKEDDKLLSEVLEAKEA